MVRRFASEHRRTALCGIESPVRVERWPWIPLLLFSDAERPLTGMSKHGFVELTRPAPAYVPENQADRPPDSGIRPTSAAEDIVAGIKAEPLDHGSAHDKERRGAMSGCLHAVEIEPLLQHGAQRRQHNRDVLWQATGHHAVDRDLLHRGDALVRRYDTDNLLGIPTEIIDDFLDQARSRKDYREAVGPTQTIDLLHCSLIVSDLEGIEFCQFL